MTQSLFDTVLSRVLEILPETGDLDWDTHIAGVWREGAFNSRFVGYSQIDDTGLEDLLNIEDQKNKLVANTEQFLAGLPANNALLWGARGTGKSTLIHALLNAYADAGLRLVEVRKENLSSLSVIVERLAGLPQFFIVFCDDLSFSVDDPSYKELKSALEGSIFKTAGNVLIYATSNRRHLVPEHMSDNQQARMDQGELHEVEAIEEKISLSDRFGLWLSFYGFRQDAYLDVVYHWIEKLSVEFDVRIDPDDAELRADALRWALARGARNGRTAQYFARHWVGQLGLKTGKRTDP
jgi:predicted AAA+ superfamily ATPase